MERNELIYWSNNHDNQFDNGIQKEREIGDELRKTKELTKTNLKKVIMWKFEPDPRRRKRELNFTTFLESEHLLRVHSEKVTTSSLF